MANMRRLISYAAMAVLMHGCAAKAPPPEPEPEAPNYWGYSRLIETDTSTITLFDPGDLAHHAEDPANWHQYDFAFANDLETGRFAAFTTSGNGAFQVNFTEAPLTDNELAVAGPSAEMRLRVINYRLLLAGGEATLDTDDQR